MFVNGVYPRVGSTALDAFEPATALNVLELSSVGEPSFLVPLACSVKADDLNRPILKRESSKPGVRTLYDWAMFESVYSVNSRYLTAVKHDQASVLMKANAEGSVLIKEHSFFSDGVLSQVPPNLML